MRSVSTRERRLFNYKEGTRGQLGFFKRPSANRSNNSSNPPPPGNGPSHPANSPHNNHGPPPPGGGGGGGNPGGGGGDPSGGNPGWPSAPYGNMPASIKTELKGEQLPEWDGNHWTAIEYFWNVQQLACLGGWLPEALGFWLWFRFKERSTVKTWFVTLPIMHQTYMRSHYLKFLKGIKDRFLGTRWQLKMNNYYNSQIFRERGHERESPTEFVMRRSVYTRMLLNVEPGGPLKVFYIMRKAPIGWGPILLLSSIKDSSELYSRVMEHEEALLEAYQVSKGGPTLSLDNIVTHLKQLGLANDRQSLPRRANLTQNSPDIPSQSDEVERGPIDTDPQISSDQHILHEAYQVLQWRQWPPPKGGYPFPKNDHVTTKMGKLPPSPCRTCGSDNHWDKECPDVNVNYEKMKRTVNMTEVSIDTESEKAYATAYSILLNERLAGEVVDQSYLQESLHQQGFKVASLLSQVMREEGSKSGEEELKSSKSPQRVTVEEIEDEFWETCEAKPKSTKHILEEEVLDKEMSPVANEREDVEPNFRTPSPEESQDNSSSTLPQEPP